ncbi:MAG: D-alanyl-D-alanine carboxypeptidase family protein [Deltaproteobacteria bacterium]|nr:D-alanyl-D-alanine carboxypeptidase family protein [Deltaproteobacteria bacterium]
MVRRRVGAAPKHRGGRAPKAPPWRGPRIIVRWLPPGRSLHSPQPCDCSACLAAQGASAPVPATAPASTPDAPPPSDDASTSASEAYGASGEFGEATTGAAGSASRWVLPEAVRVAGEAQRISYDPAPAWEGGKNCTAMTRGAALLRAFILARVPAVKTIGGYNCRPNTARTSQTSVHGTGRALDIMIPTLQGAANSAVGDPIANWLVTNASVIGVQYLIWNRVKWSGSRTGRKDAPYGGPNPHVDHIHLELTSAASRAETPWFRSLPGAAVVKEASTPAGALPARPDLVTVQGIEVARSIAGRLGAMLTAAAAAGVKLTGGGYRSPARQVELRRKHCGPSQDDIWQKPASQCVPPTARPGRSNHERGLAIDFRGVSGRMTRADPAYRWLAANAARFGFKNLPSEPWHWSVDGR